MATRRSRLLIALTGAGIAVLTACGADATATPDAGPGSPAAATDEPVAVVKPAEPAATATPPARRASITPTSIVSPTSEPTESTALSPSPSSSATPVPTPQQPAPLAFDPEPSPTAEAAPGITITPDPTATPLPFQTPTPLATPSPPGAPGAPTANVSRATQFVPLDQPRFVPAAQAQGVTGESLVLGLSWKGESRAYPLSMMWFHHIANDNVGGWPVLVTY